MAGLACSLFSSSCSGSWRDLQCHGERGTTAAWRRSNGGGMRLSHNLTVLAADNVSRGRNVAPSGATSTSSSPPSIAATLAPLAACLVLAVYATPVEAGLLSGSSGLSSFEFPSMPKSDFLQKIHEESKARYQGYDTQFKSSSLVQDLLKRSKENAEKYKQQIQDKYCERGAEWGVGDCATSAMSEEQRLAFREALMGNR